MLFSILIVLQIVILFIIGILLWQIWHFLNNDSIPDDKPLGKERTKSLTNRLNALMVCFTVEAILAIVQAVLRFILSL